MSTDDVALPESNIRVDHIAVAVRNLDEAVCFFEERLKFRVAERRVTHGDTTGMRSVVMKRSNVTFVLLEGIGDASQVSRFVTEHGPGVHHVALHVDGLHDLAEELISNGVTFSSDIIGTPALRQTFVERDNNSSLMIEFIERGGDIAFSDDNVSALFRSLEQSGKI